MTRWTREAMHALGARHAELEARQDLEGVMRTLTVNPRYEFWPGGRGFEGDSNVRRYYQHLFSHFMPLTRGYELIAEWVSEESLAQEYRIDLAVDGALEHHRVVGILIAEGELLGGERIYASERCVALMTGPLFEEMVPL